MLKSLLDLLNVRPEERLQVMLMLGAGFFMGIFFATYSVVAESLFLSSLGGELNRAFLVSGSLGVLATISFSFLQNRIRFSNLTTTSILVVVTMTAFFYVGYHYGPDDWKKPIIFLMFCMTGPITAVLLLSYWGIFGRLFNFKQSKRIIGWIDTGQLIAVIIANFLIPITQPLFPATDNYLIVCCLAIIVSAVHFLIISIRFPLIKNDPREFDASVRTETSMRKVVTDPYTKLLSLFLVISMVMLILGQFTFQELIKVQYPDQRALTNFLAYFNVSIYGLSFIMQTFVNDRVVSNYGIRIALLILPFIVGFFTISASVIGLIFGYTPQMAPNTFIYFFLFVALLRLFNMMLRDSLENPMFKLLFTPLDDRYRFGIQAKVEGVVNETGRITAGALIFAFASLSIFKIVWMPIILSVLAVLYVIVINKLYGGYKAKIRSKLENVQSGTEKLELGTTVLVEKLDASLTGERAGAAVFAFRLLEKLDPSQVPGRVNKLMRMGGEDARDFAQRKLNEMKGLSVSDRYVIRFDKNKHDVSNKNMLSKTELEALINSHGNISKARIMRLTRSVEAIDRQYAAELLLHAVADDNLSFLIELLNDSDSNVRQTAIQTAAKRNNNEVLVALIENLNQPAYANMASNALVQIGSKALSQLDSAFYRSGQPTQSLMQIVKIIGRIGGQRSRDLLWNKIDYPDKVVVSSVLLAMGDAAFKASHAQGSRIRFAIENDIGDISWNLNSIKELGDEEFGESVKAAIRSEIANDIEHVYMLLAMLYDARSIQLVKENIESGTVEGVAFAVELLDIFLSEQLKQRVIPVLDDISDADRISRLEVFYPRVALDEKLVLKFLINRDYTQTNRWTKVCVLHQIGRLRIAEFQLDLIAQLFNPDRLIREMAAWSLHQLDPALYREHAERLGHDEHRALDQVIIAADRSLMIFEKTEFFMHLTIFKGMSGLSLSFLGNIASEIHLKQNETLVLDEKVNPYFFIVYDGKLNHIFRGSNLNELEKGSFVGEMPAPTGYANAHILQATEPSVLLRFSKEQFYGLLAENIKLADRVLEYA